MSDEASPVRPSTVSIPVVVGMLLGSAACIAFGVWSVSGL